MFVLHNKDKGLIHSVLYIENNNLYYKIKMKKHDYVIHKISSGDVNYEKSGTLFFDKYNDILLFTSDYLLINW